MNALSRLTLQVLAAAVITGNAAADELYSVYSKDVGWTAIDLVISEVSWNGRVSQLRIPRYESRSAIESRFAMCAFTDIAIQRGFEVWVVSDGSITDEVVQVGFLRTGDEDAGTILGKQFVGDRALRAEVRAINRMCGIQPRK